LQDIFPRALTHRGDSSNQKTETQNDQELLADWLDARALHKGQKSRFEVLRSSSSSKPSAKRKNSNQSAESAAAGSSHSPSIAKDYFVVLYGDCFQMSFVFDIQNYTETSYMLHTACSTIMEYLNIDNVTCDISLNLI